MSRISELFDRKSDILSIYCTAGFPHLDSTGDVLMALQEYGADMIELGIPYSDPIADGPTIQYSNSVALSNGMTIKKLFEQLKSLRQSPSSGGVGEVLPVVLMGYMNPVLQYGFEKFCADAAGSGIDGLIIPDLPVHEFEKYYREIIRKHGLDFTFLITPETSEERIRKLDSFSTGFLYAVTSSSTTGNKKDSSGVADYLERLRNLGLQNPVLAGFGIQDRSQFKKICSYVQGAIIGSSYIRALQSGDNVKDATKSFLLSILSG